MNNRLSADLFTSLVTYNGFLSKSYFKSLNTKTSRIYKLIFIILIFSVSCTSHPRKLTNTYFIDAECGNDSNTGYSEKQAWKSLKNINETSFQPGSVVLLKRGQVFSGTLSFNRLDSGNSLEPVTVSCYGNDMFPLPEITSYDTSAMIADSCMFLKIKGIRFSGSGRKQGNTTSGLMISACSHIDIDSVEVSGYQKSGVEVLSSNSVKITHVNAHHNGSTGIRIAGSSTQGYSKNIYLGYCTSNDNAGDPTALENHSGSGIIVSYTDGALIEYCSATNNGWDMPRTGNGPVGIWAHDANNITIQYCISYHNESARGASDGGGFDLDGGITNSLVQYNYSFDNNGAGYGLFQYAGTSVWENNIIRYNISYNDGDGNEKTGIYIWSAEPEKDLLRNCKIYNNIIINELGSAIKYADDNQGHPTNPSGFEIYNNMFVSKDEPIEGLGTHSNFTHNYWGRWGHRKVSKKYDVTGIYGVSPGINLPRPDNYSLTDPTQLHFMELYRMHKNSPCKGAGKKHEQMNLKNFWGETVNDTPNIGIE